MITLLRFGQYYLIFAQSARLVLFPQHRCRVALACIRAQTLQHNEYLIMSPYLTGISRTLSKTSSQGPGRQIQLYSTMVSFRKSSSCPSSELAFNLCLMEGRAHHFWSVPKGLLIKIITTSPGKAEITPRCAVLPALSSTGQWIETRSRTSVATGWCKVHCDLLESSISVEFWSRQNGLRNG